MPRLVSQLQRGRIRSARRHRTTAGGAGPPVLSRLPRSHSIRHRPLDLGTGARRRLGGATGGGEADRGPVRRVVALREPHPPVAAASADQVLCRERPAPAPPLFWRVTLTKAKGAYPKASPLRFAQGNSPPP